MKPAPAREGTGSLLLFFDDSDGTPLAVMDSVYITAVRRHSQLRLPSTKAM